MAAPLTSPAPRLAPQPSHPDSIWMGACLVLARRAAAVGEIPVGAVVVRDGRIIGRGFNRREAQRDPTAHAEVIALREAGGALDRWRLTGTTLYVTLEPCPMCAGALVNGRVERLVFGCADPKAGAVGSLIDLVRDPRLNHRVAVTAGVRADECAQLLRDFFRQRRQEARLRRGGRVDEGA